MIIFHMNQHLLRDDNNSFIFTYKAYIVEHYDFSALPLKNLSVCDHLRDNPITILNPTKQPLACIMVCPLNGQPRWLIPR